MIDIHNLQFNYGDKDFLLEIPELSISAGETVAIAGPSGSGKTTLLNLIAGILQPGQGEIVVARSDLGALDDPALREFRITQLGLVFQEFELIEYLNVLDNILLPFRINGALTLTSEVREHAQALAREVGIDDKLHRFPAHLSQGEKQRVAVCRALMAEPKLVLADEPTGNLDPRNKERVLEILFTYARKQGATLITVTHDQALIPRFDRMIDSESFLNNGRQRQSGEMFQ